MGLVFESLILELIVFLLLIFYLFYKTYTEKYNYWENRGVPCIKAKFPFGSMKDIVLAETFLGKAHESLYKKFLSERFYGIIELRSPTLVVKDLELIKRILIKDFQHFMDKPGVKSNPDDYIMKHLMSLEGEEWRALRIKLTPTFTSGKLKLMFYLINKCGNQLKEFLETEVKDGKIIHLSNILDRFTMDTISTCAFGIESNAVADENSEIFQMFGVTEKATKRKFNLRWLSVCYPSLIHLFQVQLVQPKLRDFLVNIVRQIVKYREVNNVKRNDFIDLLMSVGQKKCNPEENADSLRVCNDQNSNEKLTIEQMTAQTWLFFSAGYKTTSSITSLSIYELARHQDIQERLYQALREAVDKNGGEISYQLLMDVPFLNQVLDETLRMYGTSHVLNRICNKPYKIPDSDVTVEKGVKVVIPLYAIHHDPKYYPEPYEFKPERFTPEESNKRLPFVFMPFGEGPRTCIGKRFGLLDTKFGLATVILNFKVELSPDQEVPVKINKRTVMFMAETPILLKLSKRENK